MFQLKSHAFMYESTPRHIVDAEASPGPAMAWLDHDHQTEGASGYGSDGSHRSKDTVGKSNCTGTCITNWPAYSVSSQLASLPTNITVIKRADGTLQYAWKGMPLYYFVSDKTAGAVTGNGVGGFAVAK